MVGQFIKFLFNLLYESIMHPFLYIILALFNYIQFSEYFCLQRKQYKL